jgi:hypothetical protein
MLRKFITCAVLVVFFFSLNVALAEMDYPPELEKEVALQ